VVLELLFLLVTERVAKQVDELAQHVAKALHSLRAHTDMTSIDYLRVVKGQLATVDIRIGELHVATKTLLDDEVALAGIVGALPLPAWFPTGPASLLASVERPEAPAGSFRRTSNVTPDQSGAVYREPGNARRASGSLRETDSGISPPLQPNAASPRLAPVGSPPGYGGYTGGGYAGGMSRGDTFNGGGFGGPGLSRAESTVLGYEQMQLNAGRSADELRRLAVARNARLVGDMLEVVLKNVVHTKAQIDKLQRTIDDTEELIRLQLDLARNQMLKLEMLLTIGTFCAGIGAVVVGIFGMNLTSHYEEHEQMFYLVCTALAMLLSAIFAAVWAFARSRGLL